jgi:hypothetical protein
LPPQMSLMASLSNPYIVEYKDGWVDEVRSKIQFLPSRANPRTPPRCIHHIDSELNWIYSVVAGDLRLHRHQLLRRRGHVTDRPLTIFVLFLI